MLEKASLPISLCVVCRALLKYEIHYRKISEEIYLKRNTSERLTKYDGRDACGGDEWSITDHEPSDGILNKTTGGMKWPGESHTIASEPFTYYAIFVKTMMNKDLNKDNKVRLQLLGKLLMNNLKFNLAF